MESYSVTNIPVIVTHVMKGSLPEAMYKQRHSRVKGSKGILKSVTPMHDGPDICWIQQGVEGLIPYWSFELADFAETPQKREKWSSGYQDTAVIEI